MFLGRNPELVVENVVRDFRHDIPFRDDVVRDEILQCQDTALVLRLGTNVTVLLVHANHGAWHVRGRGKRGTATAAIATNEFSHGGRPLGFGPVGHAKRQHLNQTPGETISVVSCTSEEPFPEVAARTAASRADSSSCASRVISCTIHMHFAHFLHARRVRTKQPPAGSVIGPPLHEACTTTCSDCLLAECSPGMNLS